jgi:predicted nucleic acid-binding protein
MDRIVKAESKPLSLVDSNVIVYAMKKDQPDKQCHEKCLALLEKGLKGELDYVLTVNPIIIVEVFSVLRDLEGCALAEFKTTSLLRSKRLSFLSISKETCKISVQWAREKNVPVNDAIIGANMTENADLIYTVDEEHFKKLEEYGVKTCNPTKL